MFSFGFIIPTLEVHLLEYHISHLYVSLAFILLTAAYAVFSFCGPAIFKRFDERTTVVAGISVMGLGYLMLSPWQMVFPNSLWVVLASLPILGLGQAMIYSIF